MRDRPGPSGPGLRGATRLELAPKPDGGFRSLVRLDREDERGYAAALRRGAPLLAADLGPHAHANRLLGWRDGLPVLEPWWRARRRWRWEARRLARGSRFVVTADVRDCYASIRASVVRERLLALGVAREAVEEVDVWVRAFAVRGIRGLPVGPAPSAILADAVLACGDHAIRRTGIAHLRWVDDVTIFATDRREAVGALDELVVAWGAAGLEPNDAKVALHRDPLAWLAATETRASLLAPSPRCDNPAP